MLAFSFEFSTCALSAIKTHLADSARPRRGVVTAVAAADGSPAVVLGAVVVAVVLPRVLRHGRRSVKSARVFWLMRGVYGFYDFFL